MIHQEVSSLILKLGNHQYEIIAGDEMADGYYTVLCDDGFSFIISCNEDGEWESLEPVDQFLVTRLGAVIDEIDL